MHLQRVKYKDIEQIPSLKLNKEFKTNFEGSSPAPFIGRYNYPNVNVGILSPQFIGTTDHYDSPKLWSKGNFAIGTIASLRYNLVNSRKRANITELTSQYLEIIQQIGLAKTSPILEINLEKKPELSLRQEHDITPFGPQAQITKARITSNTKINQHIEKALRDTDLKATLALQELYHKGLQESELNKILSVGALGLKHSRKLVPTRWSITAVDDTIAKELLTQVRQYPQGEYQAYFGGGWGNYYLFLFLTDNFRYELFETYVELDQNPWSQKGLKYSTDYEDYSGRKDYAQETAGGYYAARLPILEKLKEQKRQNTIIALRFITSEYNVPLGVWVCREATRKSLAQKPLTFASKELLLTYAKEITRTKFGFDLNLILNESKIIKHNQRQSTLSQF